MSRIRTRCVSGVALDPALKQVKHDKDAFATLVKEGERLAEAGNVLDRSANLERLTADEQALETLTRLAIRAGPLFDGLFDAARDLRRADRQQSYDPRGQKRKAL